MFPASREGRTHETSFPYLFGLVLAVAATVLSVKSSAAETARVHGAITDPVGAVVANAKVELLQQGKNIASTNADNHGKYEFSGVAYGHYRVRAAAATFAPQESSTFYVGGGSAAEINLTL